MRDGEILTKVFAKIKRMFDEEPERAVILVVFGVSLIILLITLAVGEV